MTVRKAYDNEGYKLTIETRVLMWGRSGQVILGPKKLLETQTIE